MQIQNGKLIENDGSEVRHAHTPGPWKIGVLDQDPNKAVVYFDDGETRAKAVCRVNLVDATRAENEANAALIVAAPDLLEALQMLSLAANQAERKLALTKASFAIALATQEDCREDRRPDFGV